MPRQPAEGTVIPVSTDATNRSDDATEQALRQARDRYAQRRPRTLALHAEAEELMPGGNTRTVLYHRPFPVRVVRASGSVLEDADGHRYVDLLGNYSAALFGHGHPVLGGAVAMAMREGVGPGAHTEAEVAMAKVLCARFPALERVRFTNSGTEANLMALTAARSYTGRERVMVFRGGYHGGVLSFAHAAPSTNAPYDVLVAPFNDIESVRSLLHDHGQQVAAVLVEPMLGASGCIPGEADFLQELRAATRATGSLLVVDEVMTSRTGRHGMADLLGVTADLTTLGKYLGGGLSFGAFGGRADVMAMFDPGRSPSVGHAGTFNNNTASMRAGHAGLTQLYPPEVAQRHTARGEALRARLNAVFDRTGACLQATGIGSLLTVHTTTSAIRRAEDLAAVDPRLQELLFLDLLEGGYYLAPRGYLALSLAVTEEQLTGFVAAIEQVVRERPQLQRRD